MMSSRSKRGRQVASEVDKATKKQTSSSVTEARRASVVQTSATVTEENNRSLIEMAGLSTGMSGQSIPEPERGESGRSSRAQERNGSSSQQRRRSPLSVSRQDEQEELASLNDRLAYYIDFVRTLQTDRERLVRKVESFSGGQSVDVEKIKQLYQDEMAQLRRMLDEVAKTKAQIEVEAKKLGAERSELTDKLGRKEKLCSDLQAKLDRLTAELNAARRQEDSFKALESEHDALTRQHSELRRQLEQETLMRTDLENRYLTAKEELEFRERVHNEERDKWQERAVSFKEEVTSRQAAQVKSLLAEELLTLREQTMADMDKYKSSLTMAFQGKLASAPPGTDLPDSTGVESRRVQEELLTTRRKTDTLNAELAKRDIELASLRQRLVDVQNNLRLAEEEKEAARRAGEEMWATEQAKLYTELADLMAVKVQLDQEILTYRKLVEAEEFRCRLVAQPRASPFDATISPTAATSRTQRTSTSLKRRLDESEDGQDTEVESLIVPTRTTRQETLTTSVLQTGQYQVTKNRKGPVEISCVDLDAGFIQLVNKSTDEVALGGWILKLGAEGAEEVTYKFNRSLKMKPAAETRVHNHDSPVTHSPPGDLVMKDKSFPQGRKMTAFLVSATGEEQASYQMEMQSSFEHLKRRRIEGSSRSQRTCNCSVM